MLYGHHIHLKQSMDQPGKVANPRENAYYVLSPFAPENLVSREGFGSPVPRQYAYSVRLDLALTYRIPP